MRHMAKSLVIVMAIVLCGMSIALAQTAPPASSSAPTTPPAGSQPNAPMAAPSPPQEKVVDGPVKQIDAMASTVQVGWLLGLLSTTVEVTPDTRIAVEGATASLQDIREGDRVKCSYETQDGKNIARSIEVTQAEGAQRTGTSTSAPRSSAPSGSPQGSTEPTPGGAKTP